MDDLTSTPISQLPRARTSSSGTATMSPVSPIKSAFVDVLSSPAAEHEQSANANMSNGNSSFGDLQNLSSVSMMPPLSPPSESEVGMPALPPTAATPQSVARLAQHSGKIRNMISPVSVADSVLDVAESLSRMSIGSESDKSAVLNSDGDKATVQTNAISKIRQQSAIASEDDCSCKEDAEESLRQADAESVVTLQNQKFMSPKRTTEEDDPVPEQDDEDEYEIDRGQEEFEEEHGNEQEQEEYEKHHEDSQETVEPEQSIQQQTFNTSMAVSENLSLPSMETSFTGSLMQHDSSIVADDNEFEDDEPESPTVVQETVDSQQQEQLRVHEEFLSSPPVSPPPVVDDDYEIGEEQYEEDIPVLTTHTLRDVAEEEYEDEDDDYDRSPLYRKGLQPSHRSSTQTPAKPLREIQSTAVARAGTATRQRLPAPTDTAIADRVKNVKVTDSAIKGFALRQQQQQQQSRSSRASLSSSHAVPNTVSKLTLKEQSALIDKLQKETFGLQLKIYYMTQELDKRSEDGIREIRNENIELKSTIARMSLEAKSMQRQIFELERKLGETSQSDARNEQIQSDRRREVEELQGEMEQYLGMIEELRADAENSHKMVEEMKEREREYVDEIDRLKKTPDNDAMLEEQIVSTLSRAN